MIRSAMFAIAVNRRRLAALCSAMLLLAPAHAMSAPLDAQEMASFLAQVRCADGGLAVAEPGCPGARPQRASDPMRMRRHDWPAPDGYQIVDSFIADDGASFVSAFSFA